MDGAYATKLFDTVIRDKWTFSRASRGEGSDEQEGIRQKGPSHNKRNASATSERKAEFLRFDTMPSSPILHAPRLATRVRSGRSAYS
jgi:hypothetical protein